MVLGRLISWLVGEPPPPPRVPPVMPPSIRVTSQAERQSISRRLRDAEARLATLQAEAGLDELRSRDREHQRGH